MEEVKNDEIIIHFRQAKLDIGHIDEREEIKDAGIREYFPSLYSLLHQTDSKFMILSRTGLIDDLRSIEAELSEINERTDDIVKYAYFEHRNVILDEIKKCVLQYETIKKHVEKQETNPKDYVIEMDISTDNSNAIGFAPHNGEYKNTANGINKEILMPQPYFRVLRLTDKIFNKWEKYLTNFTTQSQTEAAKEKKQPLLERNKIDEDKFKDCFNAAFKGAGNNINQFQNLVEALQSKDYNNKEYAQIALLIYESKHVLKSIKSVAFSKWHVDFCELMGATCNKSYDNKNTLRKSNESIKSIFTCLL